MNRLAWSGLGVVVLATLAHGAAEGPAVPDGDRLSELAWATLSFEIFLASLAFGGALLAREGVTRRLGLVRSRLSWLQTAALVAGTLGLSAALDGALDLLELKPGTALAEFEATVAGARGRALGIATLCFVLAPGLCEELLCRGLVQRGLARRFGAPAGIAAAAALFGLLHVEPIHVAVAGALGIYLGVACHLAGSLRTAVLCHVVNNAAALASASLFSGPLFGSAGGDVVAGATVAVVALLWVRASLDSSDTGSGTPAERDAVSHPRAS